MCVKPFQPLRMPITVRPISVARYTTDLITEFKPGTSPPPVKTAMLVLAVMNQLLLEDQDDRTTSKFIRRYCSIAVSRTSPETPESPREFTASANFPFYFR